MNEKGHLKTNPRLESGLKNLKSIAYILALPITMERNFVLSLCKINKINQLHALSTEFWRHGVLSGRTQRRA